MLKKSYESSIAFTKMNTAIGSELGEFSAELLQSFCLSFFLRFGRAFVEVV